MCFIDIIALLFLDELIILLELFKVLMFPFFLGIGTPFRILGHDSSVSTIYIFSSYQES